MINNKFWIEYEKEHWDEYKRHICDEVTFKDYTSIHTMPLTHMSWVLDIKNHNIHVYIKYCPYCGIKLE